MCFVAKGGMWLHVPRIKIKTKRGRDGEGGIAISLSEVLGLVHTWVDCSPHHRQPRGTVVGSTTAMAFPQYLKGTPTL